MTIKAARLDERGIFWGMDELESKAMLTALHLPEIPECDLPPGKYRWDGKTFVPLAPEQVPLSPDAPNLERAFYLLATGQAEHQDLKEWLRAYRVSVDNQIKGKG